MELSFTEILLIVVIALVVMGPHELIKTATQIGRWTAKVRTQVNNLKVMLNDEVLQDERKKLQETLNLANKTIDVSKPLNKSKPLNESNPLDG